MKGFRTQGGRSLAKLMKALHLASKSLKGGKKK